MIPFTPDNVLLISSNCSSLEGSTLSTQRPACSSETNSLQSNSNDIRIGLSPLSSNNRHISSEIPMPSSLTNIVPDGMRRSASGIASSTSTCHLLIPARGVV